MLNHLNRRILEETDQEKNLTRQIYEKNNSWADILSRKSDFIKKKIKKKKQIILWANQKKQLEYVHCWITWIEEFLNE